MREPPQKVKAWGQPFVSEGLGRGVLGPLAAAIRGADFAGFSLASPDPAGQFASRAVILRPGRRPLTSAPQQPPRKVSRQTRQIPQEQLPDLRRRARTTP